MGGKLERMLVKIGKENLPFLLKEIPDPPEEIYIKGTWPPKRLVAIVGTRKASERGKKIAYSLAGELTNNGIGVISGLARGIDVAAHRGCVENGYPTWAVLAGGLDYIYPPENEELAREIIKLGGGLMSESPAGMREEPYMFLKRNRIISGLVMAVIIIEAPRKSGAMATARLALEQGREVYVLPGPADDFNYKGSNELIDDGANVLNGIEDILDIFR